MAVLYHEGSCAMMWRSWAEGQAAPQRRTDWHVEALASPYSTDPDRVKNRAAAV
jgi:hypothetical protein